MKHGSHEHGVSCVEFMSLSSPHRWSAVSSFMEDRNSTVNFYADASNSDRPYGTCGLRPDEALMRKECEGTGHGKMSKEQHSKLLKITAMLDKIEDAAHGFNVDISKYEEHDKAFFLRGLRERRLELSKIRGYYPKKVKIKLSNQPTSQIDISRICGDVRS